MSLIIAIDPSLTATGVVVGDEDDYRALSFSSAATDGSVVERIERYEKLVDGILSWIDGRHGIQPDAVVIEGYSMGSQGRALTGLAEYGGLLRWHLIEYGCPIYEVPPATLKKFVTGTGNCKKELVVAEIAKRYGVIFPTTDYYDAYGLYRLGLGIVGDRESLTKYQLEAIATVTTARKRPAKTKRATKGNENG